MSKKEKITCDEHPGRIAAAKVNHIFMCWECFLGRNRFVTRFGSAFFEKDDTVWLIHNPDDRCVYCANKDVKCDTCKDFKHYNYKK